MNINKPTLLVLTSTFPRWNSDSEPRFVYDLSKRLASNFQIIILAPHAANTALAENWEGMQIYRYRYAPTRLETLAYNGGITANLKQKPWKFLLLPWFFIGQWWALHKLLKKHNIDIIHAHWLIPQGLIAALALLANKKNTKLVCTSHGGDLFGLQDKLSTLLKSWVISRSSALTVVSQIMVTKIQELNRTQFSKIHVIPMGTDLTHTFVPNPNVIRQNNRLLFVGRLVEKKGLTYLLDALQQLKSSHANLELIIAGSGPLQTQLMAQTKKLGLTEQVQFVGRLTHLELVHLYQTATLAVFPFIQAKDGDMEGLGLVMVEAMGCGCPVIASDLPAVRDVIVDQETGFLIFPANTKMLTHFLEWALNNQNKHHYITNQALKMVYEKFDWSFITNKYIKVLEELIVS